MLAVRRLDGKIVTDLGQCPAADSRRPTQRTKQDQMCLLIAQFAGLAFGPIVARLAYCAELPADLSEVADHRPLFGGRRALLATTRFDAPRAIART